VAQAAHGAVANGDQKAFGGHGRAGQHGNASLLQGDAVEIERRKLATEQAIEAIKEEGRRREEEFNARQNAEKLAFEDDLAARRTAAERQFALAEAGSLDERNKLVEGFAAEDDVAEGLRRKVGRGGAGEGFGGDELAEGGRRLVQHGHAFVREQFVKGVDRLMAPHVSSTPYLAAACRRPKAFVG
jgi:hypothetical protein